MYKKCELFSDPLTVDGYGKEIEEYSEMTEFDKSFLCGLIREKRPINVLEVGVAAGATTAVILNCLEMLGIKANVYSVDLSEKYYWNSNYRTGFVAEEMKKKFSGKHRFFLGKLLPEVIGDIDGQIDFAILDTIHMLPGEVLDFPVLLTKLADDATVVFHDINLGNIGDDLYGMTDGFIATRVAIGCIVGNKIIQNDLSRPAGIPNIGAITITEDTRKYISNIFDMMSMPWSYWLNDEQVEIYYSFYESNYSLDCANAFKQGVLVNAYRELLNRMGLDVDIMIDEWKKADKFMIYGDGEWCKRIIRVADAYNLKIDAIVVSDNYSISNTTVKIPKIHFSDMDVHKNCVVVNTVVSEPRKIVRRLLSSGYEKVFTV